MGGVTRTSIICLVEAVDPTKTRPLRRQPSRTNLDKAPAIEMDDLSCCRNESQLTHVESDADSDHNSDGSSEETLVAETQSLSHHRDEPKSTSEDEASSSDSNRSDDALSLKSKDMAALPEIRTAFNSQENLPPRRARAAIALVARPAV